MTKKRKKIIQYRADCIGCGSCLEYAPDNWEMDPTDGKMRLKRSVEKDGIYITEIAEHEIEANLFAAKACPMQVIRILNEQGNKINQ